MQITHSFASSLFRSTGGISVVCLLLTGQTPRAQEQAKFHTSSTRIDSRSLAGAQAIPKQAAALESRLAGKLSPSTRAKILGAAKAVSARKGGFSNAEAALKAAESEVRKRFPGITNDSDIMALAFLVMMQASRDADQDLKAIMTQVKKRNEQKKGATEESVFSRDLRKEVRRPVQSNAQGTSDLSQMQSLRLQMLMDRRSKFISTLSNMMKKMSDTQSNIIQNIK